MVEKARIEWLAVVHLLRKGERQGTLLELVTANVTDFESSVLVGQREV